MALCTYLCIGAQNPDAQIVSSPFSHAMNFISRYVEMSKPPVDTDGVRKASEEGLTFTVGNASTLRNLPSDAALNLTLQDNTYIVSWSKDGNVICECRFPANITLLTASNAIELENDLIGRLNSGKRAGNGLRRPSRPVAVLNGIPYTAGLYSENRGYYISPVLKNEIIYQTSAEGDSIATLMLDFDKYRYETLANVMLSGYNAEPTDITVSVAQYGFKHTAVTLPFAALFQILSADNATPYWGIESTDGQKIKGILLFENKYLGFVHVMSVEADFTDGLTLKANLSPYVRMDNVKALFGEFLEQ